MTDREIVRCCDRLCVTISDIYAQFLLDFHDECHPVDAVPKRQYRQLIWISVFSMDVLRINKADCCDGMADSQRHALGGRIIRESAVSKEVSV